MPAKTYFQVHVSVGILEFSYLRWTKNFYLVEALVMVTPTWSSYFTISMYSDGMQNYLMVLEQWRHILAAVLATVTWLDEDQIYLCLVTWLDYYFCLHVKLFLLSIFESVVFGSSMSCIVLDIELAEKDVKKELGVFIDGSVKGHSFRPPKKYKPTKQAVWCTRNLHGIVWNDGHLDYSELRTFFQMI